MVRCSDGESNNIEKQLAFSRRVRVILQQWSLDMWWKMKPCREHPRHHLLPWKALKVTASSEHVFWTQTLWERCESWTAGLHSIHFDLNSLKGDAAGTSLTGCLQQQQQTEQKEWSDGEKEKTLEVVSSHTHFTQATSFTPGLEKIRKPFDWRSAHVVIGREPGLVEDKGVAVRSVLDNLPLGQLQASAALMCDIFCQFLIS